MAKTILKKYSIPVITHTGTSHLTFYYTEAGTVPGPVGTFSTSAVLPTNAPAGSSLVGYKLRIETTVVAHFKAGFLYFQTAVGYSYSSSYVPNVLTTMQQYEKKIVFTSAIIDTFYNAIRNAIIDGKLVRFEAIYETIRINLNGVATDDIKQVIFNRNDCDVVRYDEGGGWRYLFSKSSVTLKYVSKVNLPTTGGRPTCTIQTVTGMNNVLMPNYKINKYVFPTSVQYNSTIDTIFEREETDEIYNWKDQVCLPYPSVRSTVMTIPQKSKYIKSINAFKITKSDGSIISQLDLGAAKKMLEFDEAVISEDSGYRKFEVSGGYDQSDWSYYATYIEFYLLLKNTSNFSDDHGIVWTFTVRDMNIPSGSVGTVRVKIKSGSTEIASELFGIQNNQTYSGILRGIKGYSVINFVVEPHDYIGSTTKLAFCPFYIKE